MAVNGEINRMWSKQVYKHKPIRQSGEDLYSHPTYTIPEAAEQLAIDEWTLYSWYSGQRPVLRASGWYGPEKLFPLLSFRDVEEAYKIHLLRNKHEYSMQYLRDALVRARRESKSEHPLITHNMIVFDELLIEKPRQGRRDKHIVSLGPVQRPLYIPEVIDTWGKRIVDEKGRKQIFPWRHAAIDAVSRPVSLDPEVMSGRLVVTGTRIPVVILRKRRSTGEPPESIAKDYGIDVDVVQKALEHIGKAA